MLALHWPFGPWPLDAGLWTLVPSDAGRHWHWSLSALVVFGSGRCENPLNQPSIIQQPIRRIVQRLLSVPPRNLGHRDCQNTKELNVDGAACHRQDAGDRSGFAELESGFQSGNNNTQIAAPQKATNQANESQTSTSSRVIVGFCQMMLV